MTLAVYQLEERSYDSEVYRAPREVCLEAGQAGWSTIDHLSSSQHCVHVNFQKSSPTIPTFVYQMILSAMKPNI